MSQVRRKSAHFWQRINRLKCGVDTISLVVGTRNHLNLLILAEVQALIVPADASGGNT